MSKSEDVNKIIQQIADEVLVMSHPTISGIYEDSWHMFRYTRNKAIEIIESYIDKETEE